MDVDAKSLRLTYLNLVLDALRGMEIEVVAEREYFEYCGLID